MFLCFFSVPGIFFSFFVGRPWPLVNLYVCHKVIPFVANSKRIPSPPTAFAVEVRVGLAEVRVRRMRRRRRRRRILCTLLRFHFPSVLFPIVAHWVSPGAGSFLGTTFAQLPPFVFPIPIIPRRPFIAYSSSLPFRFAVGGAPQAGVILGTTLVLVLCFTCISLRTPAAFPCSFARG